MNADPHALRSLAGLLRSGLTLRQALIRWADEAGGSDRRTTRTIGDRVRLGFSPAAAAAGSAYGPLLATPFSLHLAGGIDLARWLDETAAALDRRLAAVEAARAATSGAILSGRMVAGLPLLFVPLVPMTRGSVTDAAGVAILVAGIALACTGLKWIGRLVPSPPAEDPVGALCQAVAALMEAGLGLPAALESATQGEARSHPTAQARRLVRLGWSWSRALAEVDPAFAPMTRAIETARRLGLPVADQLRAVEDSRRAAAAREFERRLRRAPVLMVVPLTCCVLPAYGLLGLAPFLRGMSMG